jgi:DNA-binding NarL/FixJ family response regulator
MTSGKRLTERQVHAILRLAAYQTEGGEWKLTETEIAHELDLYPSTVHEHIRQAAVAWGKHTQWKAEDFPNQA